MNDIPPKDESNWQSLGSVAKALSEQSRSKQPKAEKPREVENVGE